MKKLLMILLCGAVAACGVSNDSVERKMIGFMEKFDRWDYNGDGFLSSEELDEAEERGGVPKSEIIKFYDEDKDQRVSFDEGDKGMSRAAEARDILRKKRPKL